MKKCSNCVGDVSGAERCWRRSRRWRWPRTQWRRRRARRSRWCCCPSSWQPACSNQAHEGALEAAAELQNPEELQFLARRHRTVWRVTIEIVTNSTTARE